mmetsp:Transcript_1862/g.6897  ORF Transcript_1862/g.6897 Transcript_1862/m.6897 type:complete len:205 (-) Transcript_1862:310-924(-)
MKPPNTRTHSPQVFAHRLARNAAAHDWSMTWHDDVPRPGLCDQAYGLGILCLVDNHNLSIKRRVHLVHAKFPSLRAERHVDAINRGATRIIPKHIRHHQTLRGLVIKHHFVEEWLVDHRRAFAVKPRDFKLPQPRLGCDVRHFAIVRNVGLFRLQPRTAVERGIRVRLFPLRGVFQMLVVWRNDVRHAPERVHGLARARVELHR